VVTFLEGLGDGVGVAASQSGTMMHPIAKSNVATQARRRIEEGKEAEEWARCFINGEAVAPNLRSRVKKALNNRVALVQVTQAGPMR
jgi:hypothetical protein